MKSTYRTRSLPVQAFQWVTDPIPAWAQMAMQGENPRIVQSSDRMDTAVYVMTAGHGLKRVAGGDWIIQMPGGAIDACDWEVFDLFYTSEEVP